MTMPRNAGTPEDNGFRAVPDFGNESRSLRYLHFRHAVLLAGIFLAQPVLAATAPGTPGGPQDGRTIGFVISTFRWAHNPGADDCPTGLTDTRTANYLKTLAGAEKKRLSNPDDDEELVFRSMYQPSGLDSGSAPAEALAWREGYPGFLPVQSRKSWGLNLTGTKDGKPMPADIRPHRKFIGMNGEPDIDNELYRAFGCTKYYRWDAAAGESVTDPFDDKDLSGRDNNGIRDGATTILLELTDVDDRRNDNDVGVAIYSGRNSVMRDALGKIAGYSSQTTDANPAWQNKTRGRIVNGVLETDPFDIRLKYSEAALVCEYFIRGARFQLTLLPDGGARGVLAGYSDLNAIYWPLPGTYRLAYEGGSNHDGPAEYRTLHEFADGYPDPETGHYKAISSARAINAVPAFIFHSPVAQQAMSQEAIAGNERKGAGAYK